MRLLTIFRTLLGCRHRCHVPDGTMWLAGACHAVRRCCRCQARLVVGRDGRKMVRVR